MSTQQQPDSMEEALRAAGVGHNNNESRNQSRSLTLMIIAVASLSFLGILSETSLNIAFATMMTQFHVNASVIQWLTTGYLLVVALAMPLSPFLVRKFHTKKLFLSGVIIFMVGTTLCAFSPTFAPLLMGRLIMAVGTGISLPLVMTITLEKAPLNRRGLMLGIVGLVNSSAPAIGPIYGGIVVEFLGWHWIFLLLLPLMLVSLILGARYITDIRHGSSPRISLLSVVLISLTLAGFVFSLAEGSDWNWDWRFWTLLALSVAFGCGFVILQHRIAHPLLDMSTFRHGVFAAGLGIIMIVQACLLGLNFLLPLVLQHGLGNVSVVASLLLLPGAALGSITTVTTGNMLQTLRSSKVQFSGVVVALLGMMASIPAAGNQWLLMVAYIIFAMGVGMVSVSAQTHTLNQLPKAQNADGSAIVNTLQTLAGSLGTALGSTAITTSMATLIAQGMQHNVAYQHAFAHSLWQFVALLGVGFILSIVIAAKDHHLLTQRHIG